MNPLWRLALAAVLALLLAACGAKTPPGPTAAEQAAFDKATPEAKESWDALLKADKANDYTVAYTLIQKVSAMELSTEQREALKKESVSFNARFQAALEKDDAAAKQALAEIRKAGRPSR